MLSSARNCTAEPMANSMGKIKAGSHARKGTEAFRAAKRDALRGKLARTLGPQHRAEIFGRTFPDAPLVSAATEVLMAARKTNRCKWHPAKEVASRLRGTGKTEFGTLPSRSSDELSFIFGFVKAITREPFEKQAPRGASGRSSSQIRVTRERGTARSFRAGNASCWGRRYFY